MPPNLTGPSSIFRGVGEVTSSEKLAKTPIITQYAPQLPIGPPGPPTLFPHFPPVTPHSGPPIPPEIAAGGHLPHKQEHDEQQQQQQQQLALWQQQQHHHQQQWLKQLAEQHQHQQQLQLIMPPPGSAHHPTPFQMPVVTSHGHVPPHSAEPVAFTFNPEEVAAAMRSGGGRVGLPPGASIEHLAAAGLIPPGQQIVQSTFPFATLDSYQLAMSGRLQEEQAAAALAAAAGGGGLIPLIQAGIPISIEQQQLILAQQQQQVLMQVAAVNNTSLPELTEFLRQAEGVAIQIQKEPALLQDPNLQLMMKRRELLVQQIQSVGMQLDQFQRMQQEVILQHHHQQHQAELLQKQQQQQQQQFILTRPPLPEEVHSRNRPGVIVGRK